MNTGRRSGAIVADIAGAGVVAFLAILLAAAASGQTAVKLESPVMKGGDELPKKYTTAGRNVSPPLVWSNLPGSARELALVFERVHDRRVFWIAYRIPVALPGLPEALSDQEVIASPKKLSGLTQGLTDFRSNSLGYHGPPPRSGAAAEYRFTLYALDANLGLRPGLDRDSLLYLIKGHIVGKGELTVTDRK